MQSTSGVIEALGNSVLEKDHTDYSVIRLRTGSKRNRVTIIENARVFSQANTTMALGNDVTLHHEKCVGSFNGATANYELVFAVTEGDDTLDDIRSVDHLKGATMWAGIFGAIISFPLMLVIVGFFIFIHSMGELYHAGSMPSEKQMRAHLKRYLSSPAT